MADAWTQLTEHMERIETLSHIRSTLQWDEQTGMPPAAAPAPQSSAAATSRNRLGPHATLLLVIGHARSAPFVPSLSGV